MSLSYFASRNTGQHADTREITKIQNSSLEALQAEVNNTAGAAVVKTFTSPFFMGVSVEAANSSIASLSAMESAGNVWPSQQFSIDVAGMSSLEGSGIGSMNWSVHGMTGVDELHAAGITGKGVQVAIIDTGIDYSHPAVSIKAITSYRCRWSWPDRVWRSDVVAN